MQGEKNVGKPMANRKYSPENESLNKMQQRSL